MKRNFAVAVGYSHSNQFMAKGLNGSAQGEPDMIHILNNIPHNNSSGHYLDDPILFTLDQNIELSYLTDDYITIWKTNQDQSEFYSQISINIESGDSQNIIKITPDPILSSEEYYIVVLTGGENGIKSIGGDILDGNFVLFFKSGVTVRPTTDTEEPIEGVDLFLDGKKEEIFTLSSDAFSADSANARISLVNTIPEDYSIGVKNIDKVIYIYNDDVYDNVPDNILVGKYSELPVDPDPFGDRAIQSSGVIVSDHSVAFLVSGIVDIPNREYIFKLPANKIRGINREEYDNVDRYIRFMSELTPVYATPDQILIRLKGFNPDMTIRISEYDVYKLIHEKSIYVSTEIGITVDSINLAMINRLVVCLVLRELIVTGMLLSGGNIKSRMLLMNEVVYENFDIKDILMELDNCIKENTPEGSSLSTVKIGIKSGKWMNRQGKNYNIYR